jgi:iron complex transport system ATP-binding protein
MAKSDSLINIKHLNWHAGKQQILTDINCQVPQGQMLGVIGPNGAGKSSLLRCIYRVTQPSSGTITYNNNNIWNISAREYARTMAVVLQETPHNFDMSVSQLVAMGLTPHKSLFAFTSQQDHRIVYDAIRRVGLSEHADQPIQSLSGGEKQRALIARAIVQQPQILVMDEPTNHLDIKYQIQTLELVKSLGITVIVSIHDLNLASAMCDQLVVLNKGKLITQGTPSQVITPELLGNVFGICATVSEHPQTGNPSICYYYGYQQGAHNG